MDTEEREIFQFLKSWGNSYTGAMEICRRAGSKKKFYEDPNWAKPILLRMEERDILESDMSGRYRIKSVPRHKKGHGEAAPDAASDSSEEVGTAENAEGEIADDDHYDKL